MGITTPLIAAASGFGGVCLGSWLTSRRDRATRRHAFVSRQLAEFYAPLHGLRQEIKTRSDLRVKLQGAAGQAWRKLTDETEGASIEAKQKLTKERFPEFQRLIEWDNKNFDETLLPAYRKMIDVFRDNLMLAEPETVPFFGGLIEFVEVWDRHKDKSIPYEVIEAIGHGEAKLHDFYKHIETKHGELRQRLATGRIDTFGEWLRDRINKVCRGF